MTTLDKKYELLESDTVTDIFGSKLFRIRALRTIAGVVMAGALGGYIQSEVNLSHDDNGWVFDNGQVSGNGRVFDNGQVSGNGRVFDNGQVSGNGRVFDNGRVSGNGRVFGNGWVSGDGWVFDNGRVSGDGWVFGDLSVAALHMDGLTWPVTIADSQMVIGCQVHTLAEWEGFDDRQILAMDGRDALRFWRGHKSLLLGLARANGREWESPVVTVEQGEEVAGD